jgi:long-chain acyl-CoA synthetase
MYEAQAEKDWKYIINDSDSKLVLVATERIFEKTEHYIDKVPTFPLCASSALQVGKVESVLCLDSSEEYLHSYKRFLPSFSLFASPLTDPSSLRWRAQVTPSSIPPSISPDKDDISIIIYTSGTTGNPKARTPLPLPSLPLP